MADDEKEQIARDYIQRLIDGHTAALLAELSPELRTEAAQSQLEQIHRLMADKSPAVTNLVGYNWHKAVGGAATYNLTYQFGYGSKQWVLANAAWRETPDGRREIIGLTATPLAASLQEINGFSFKKAGGTHYLLLAAALIVPVFIITTLVVCIRTKIARRKWLWVIFILLGVTSFSLNWTTGQTGISPLSIQLLGVSATASSVYSPWIISVSLPIGAIVFWLRRRKLTADLESESESTMVSST